MNAVAKRTHTHTQGRHDEGALSRLTGDCVRALSSSHGDDGGDGGNGGDGGDEGGDVAQIR